FSQGAKEAIVVERSLHDGFMKNFDISKQQFEETPHACLLFLQNISATLPQRLSTYAPSHVQPCISVTLLASIMSVYRDLYVYKSQGNPQPAIIAAPASLLVELECPPWKLGGLFFGRF
ncbi:MAG: hypothetical protein RR584_15945, partial [Comamonas sp.]